MNTSDLKELKRWISSEGALDRSNEDLIDDAIWAADHGSDYRAQSDLRTLAANLRSSGQSELAGAVERYI